MSTNRVKIIRVNSRPFVGQEILLGKQNSELLRYKLV